MNSDVVTDLNRIQNGEVPLKTLVVYIVVCFTIATLLTFSSLNHPKALIVPCYFFGSVLIGVAINEWTYRKKLAFLIEKYSSQ